MNFFNRKPKAVAPTLAEKPTLDIALPTLLDEIKTLREQAEQDAATIETQGGAIADLHAKLEDAEERAKTFHEAWKSTEEQLAMAHDVEIGQREVLATQKAVIENLKQEPKALADTMADIAAREEALRILSRRAIHLLFKPRGMRRDWQIDRERLLAEFKAIGIEDE